MNTNRTAELSLGDFLKNYRLAEDLTQDDLAKILQVSKQRISDIEKNRFNVSIKLCKRMAKSLDLPVEWLAKLALQDLIHREGITLKVG
jgi:putative transcriptional regulator